MRGLLDDYTFYFVDLDTDDETQCYPDIEDLTFSDEQDESFRFFRRVITTEMQFKGSDYAYLWPFEDAGCSQIGFVVKYKGSEVYKGLILFGTENIGVDLRNCIMTIRIDPEDEYTCLLNGWEQERNLLLGRDRYSAQTEVGELEYDTCTTPENNSFTALYVNGAPVTCLDSDDPSGLYEDWTLIFWEIENVAPGVWRSVATFAREVATVDCDGATAVEPPGDGWFLQSDDCAGSGTSTWVRAPGRVFVPEESIDDRPNEIYKETWRVAGVPEGETQRTTTAYGNAIKLKEVLPVLAAFCSLDVVSDFYDIDADGTAPSNSEYTAAAADLKDLLIYQKSDIKLPTASQPATQALWSLKGLLESLQLQHDIEIRIQDGVMRIEHMTYWQSLSAGIDITTGQYQPLGSADIRYSNNGQQVARQERWSFAEEVSFDFRGLPIFYAECVPRQAAEEQQYNMQRVNNDISFIASNAERSSNDGFTFAAAKDVGGQLYIPYSNMPSTLGGNLVLNAAMSIPNLLDKYHRNRRPLLNGALNAQDVTFNSAIPRRELDEITLIMDRAYYHSSFDPAAAVSTALGDAEVITAEYNAADCSLTLTLRA